MASPFSFRKSHTSYYERRYIYKLMEVICMMLLIAIFLGFFMMGILDEIQRRPEDEMDEMIRANYEKEIRRINKMMC